MDGSNDMDLFDPVDLKVAFNAQENVRMWADAKVEGKNLRPFVNLARDEPEKREGSAGAGNSRTQGA